MFTTEQHIPKIVENTRKKGLLNAGTTIARPRIVKQRINYKQVTVGFGILVALLIAFSLWTATAKEKISGFQPVPEISIPAVLTDLAATTLTFFTTAEQEF
jgi:hypothetical protein